MIEREGGQGARRLSHRSSKRHKVPSGMPKLLSHGAQSAKRASKIEGSRIRESTNSVTFVLFAVQRVASRVTKHSSV